MSGFQVDGDGFLVNRDDWSQDVMAEIADNSGIELTEEVHGYCMLAREMYEAEGVVPPIRTFGKAVGDDRKGSKLNAIFNGGVMKKIAKLAGLPKPTGCV